MVKSIVNTIKKGDSEGLVHENNILTGYSGNKIIGTLQRLGDIYSDNENICYLEIGVYQGLTLLSTANSNPNLPCYGIDNFAFFDPDSQNFGIVKERIKRLDLDNVHIINNDYEKAFAALETEISDDKIGIYFIDGPHDYRSQLMCLQLSLPYLHEHSVIVIDDCNYEHVRQANADFLKTHPGFKLLFEAYTSSHPKNMDEAERESAKKGWWNGINIIVKDPSNILTDMYPPTSGDRTLFLNEHIIHASKYADLAPTLSQILSSLSSLKLRGCLLKIGAVVKSLFQNRDFYSSRHNAMNTSTEEITKYRFNQVPKKA